MKEEEIQKEDGKASKASNITINATYLDPKYAIPPPQTIIEIRPRGPLVLFEINPSREGPSFIARFDGGSRDEGKEEQCFLDIDIKGVSDEEELRFKKGEDGYSGHQTKGVQSDTEWKFPVFLCTPDRVIFEGTVCFNLHRKMGFESNLGFEGKLGI